MKGQRILVVEDDQDTLLLLTSLLQAAGYTVLTALDPSQALMQAQREKPALILTDILMPAGGGLSVLKRLKMSTKTGTIPIIVLTALGDPQIEAEALAAGALRLLRKPWDNAVLLDAIKTAIGGEGDR